MHRRDSDRLLGEHVQWIADDAQWFEVSRPHAFDAGHHADDLLARDRVEQRVRHSPDLVVGASDALQAR